MPLCRQRLTSFFTLLVRSKLPLTTPISQLWYGGSAPTKIDQWSLPMYLNPYPGTKKAFNTHRGRVRRKRQRLTFQKPCTGHSRSLGNNQLKAKLLCPFGQ